jgi:predicted metal-dependent hydrolase
VNADEGAPPLLDEVADFLRGLTRELPEIFPSIRRKGGRKIPFRGGELELRVEEDPAAKRSALRDENGVLVLRRSPQDDAHNHDLLRAWYVEQARAIFAERAAHWAQAMQTGYARIRIADQRTLWGSCTRDGTLSFNWRVVMAPPETLDYLVIHELAHLREMNHSKRFWAIVAVHCPDWKVHRRWLRDHSRRLKTAIRRAPRRAF